jgi:hypothetical protein
MHIARTIKKYGVSRVARASGYPISTIHRWYTENKIPGTGKAKELRKRELLAAFAALDAAGAADTRAAR